MWNTRIKFVFALAAVVALGGCSSLAKKLIEKPKVALESVNVGAADSAGATVLFAVKVDNPNAFPLKVDAVNYALEVGGKALASGRLEDLPEVPARDAAVLNIPVAVKYADVFTSLGDFLSRGTSPFKLTGDASFGLLTVPFQHAGELKLK